MRDAGIDNEQQPEELDALRRRRAELEASRAEVDRIEEAMRQSEESFRAALSNISEAVFITNGAGSFTFISPNVHVIFGYSPTEIRRLGKITKLLGDVPFDPEELETLGEIRNIEHEITDKAGRRRVLLINIRSVSIGRGKTLYTCLDITTRKRAQEQLRKHRDHLEELVEERAAELRATNEQLAQRNKLLSALSHIQSQFIAEADPRVLFDRLLDDLLSLTESKLGFIGQVLHAADGKPYLKTHAVTNIVWGEETGQRNKQETSSELSNLRPIINAVMTSGKYVIIHDPANDPRCEGVTTQPPLDSFLGLPLYSGQELIGMVGIANRPRGYDTGLIEFLQPFLLTCGNIIEAHRNVQQRQQAEEELQKSERNFRNSIDSSPLGTSIVTRDGRLIYANQAFLDIYGYDSVEALKAVPLRKRYTRQSYAQHRARRRRMRLGESVAAHYELSIIRRDGEIRDLSVSWDRVLWDGEPQFQVIYQDITDRKRAETALLESRRRFRDLANLLPQSIWETDEKGNFTYMNQQGLESFGYSPEEVESGLNAYELFVTEDRERAGANMQKILDGEDVGGIEYTARKKDGSTFPALIYAARITGEGKSVGLRGVTVDIVELKLAEQQRMESEERYRLLFERSSDAIFLLDQTTGRYLDCNAAAERLTGRSAAEIRALVPDASDLPDGLRQLQRLTMAKDIQDPGEVTFTRPDGTKRTALLAATRLNGHFIFGIARDITERKQAEETLRNSEASLANAQRIAHLGNWDWDIQNNTFHLSEEASRIFALEPGEEGEPYEILSRLVHPDDREFVQKSIVQALFEGKPYDYEYRILRPDGSEGVVHVRGEVTFDESEKPIQASGTIQDITEHRTLEKKVVEYQELNEMKSNLLSTVSHELRTPLAIIKGYSTLLLDYEDKLEQDEKHEYVESIDKATSRLVDLVNHILDMSRLDSGLLQLERTSVSIARLIREAAAEARLRAPGHTIQLNLATGLPRVRIDTKRIRQVLDNILDNAIKYSDEGTEIIISAERQDKEMVVSISDQGIGIPAEDLDKVFDRMYRATHKKNQETGGVGLGLAICRGLVEAHGGHIWIESEEGKGTTVFFKLPL
jgi:PAS domain S-box-containing protein